MAASRPWETRKGPAGSVYGLPSVQRLVCAAADVPDMPTEIARMALSAHGLRLSHEKFALVWSSHLPMGPIVAGDLLGTVNSFRAAAARAPAPAAHIVPYDGWIDCRFVPTGQLSARFSAVRAACGVAWSDDFLRAVLARHFLVAEAVAHSIAGAARAVGIACLPLRAPPNSLGKVLPSAQLRKEHDAYLNANGLSGFAY